MNPSLRLALTVAFATTLASTTQAAIVLNGSPFFGGPPNTAPGNSITQLINWSFSPSANGFSLTGRVRVTVPAGVSAGLLLSWDAEDLINNGASTSGTYNTTTTYTGYIFAPAGGAADGGTMDTYLVDKTANTVYPSSISTAVFSYAAGAGTTLYPPPGPAVSPNFFYPNLVGNFDSLNQTYSVNYSYSGVIPGDYILDFPADSFVIPAPTPEPTAAALLGLAAPLLLGLRRRRQG